MKALSADIIFLNYLSSNNSFFISSSLGNKLKLLLRIKLTIIRIKFIQNFFLFLWINIWLIATFFYFYLVGNTIINYLLLLLFLISLININIIILLLFFFFFFWFLVWDLFMIWGNFILSIASIINFFNLIINLTKELWN